MADLLRGIDLSTAGSGVAVLFGITVSLVAVAGNSLEAAISRN